MQLNSNKAELEQMFGHPSTESKGQIINGLEGLPVTFPAVAFASGLQCN